MKYAICLLLFASLMAHADDVSIPVYCTDGYCIMKESDVVELQSALQFLQKKVRELKSTTGCT